MIKLLDNVSTTGAGDSWHGNGIYSKHAVQIIDNSASATAIEIHIQGSLDNINFYNLAEYVFSSEDLIANGTLFSIVYSPVSYIRANLITYTGGSNLTTFYIPFARDIDESLIRGS